LVPPACSRPLPSVHFEPDAIYIAGPPIFTSAGVSAGIDLELTLVEADWVML
jgi:transcriptional regulator GlxA family with amidase domain